MIKANTKYKKIYKTIIGTVIVLFAFLGTTYAYDDEYHYNYKNLGNLGANSGDFYLGDISATSDFRMHIVYQSYDCEQYNDFAFMLNGVTQAIPCSGGGNRTYVVEFGTIENLTANSIYEMYLVKYRNDRRGLGQLDIYIEYIDGSGGGTGTGTTDNGTTDYDNIFFGKRFKLFSDIDDMRTFFTWQTGVMVFILLSIMILKIFIYKRI